MRVVKKDIEKLEDNMTLKMTENLKMMEKMEVSKAVMMEKIESMETNIEEIKKMLEDGNTEEWMGRE